MRTEGTSKRRRGVGEIIADNSLSIVLFALFGVCVAGQALVGWFDYDGSLGEANLPRIGFGAYLRTGNFLDGIFSNWQAAILQLLVLIGLSSVLRQKGAAHSRKSEEEYPRLHWRFARRNTWRQWFYANSLSLAFLVLFVSAFALHLGFGQRKTNEDRALRGLPGVSLIEYAASATFWNSTLQCWEAEFGAIGIYIVASIFLRQERSPESKKVGSSDESTGDPNE